MTVLPFSLLHGDEPKASLCQCGTVQPCPEQKDHAEHGTEEKRTQVNIPVVFWNKMRTMFF
jgi:hypothetical protein